jgi:hypothetical protein
LADALAGLGSNLLGQRRWAEAEPALRESLGIRAARQPDAPSTFEARGLLGRCLVGQGRYAEAEPLILEGYRGMRSREAELSAPGLGRMTEAGRRVVALYEAWGKPGLASEWKAKVGLVDLPADVFSP